MFAAGTARLFEDLLRLPERTPDDLRRVLSEAYAYVLSQRLRAELTTEEDLEQVRDELDALVATFETHVILNPELSSSAQEASAFVAAEAAYLLARLASEASDGHDFTMLWPAKYHHAIRSGLLYLLSHHYSNARQTADRLLAETPQVAFGIDSTPARTLFLSFRAYLRLETVQPDAVPNQTELSNLTDGRVRAYAANVLSATVNEHGRWLALERAEFPSEQLAELERLEAALATTTRYPWIVGLIRLARLVMERVTPRALRIQTWNSDSSLHLEYLKNRCPQRPLLWPSGLELSQRSFPGMGSNAVVSIPTGSGKGFLAETAIAQVMDEGWVIYLVPTNALANQVRRDLAHTFAFSDSIRVQAFLGGQEFSLLPTEAIEEVEAGTIVVMTPEKCAAALRRSEAAFSSLRLLIFDECHLLAETGSRGPLAELVVAHIASLAPDLAVLFTSALLENPEDLAEWLSAITGRESHTISHAWRPTRTMRGVIGVHGPELNDRGGETVEKLSALPERRKNLRFEAPYRAVVSLQGPWTSTQAEDYALLDPPLLADLKVSREGRPESWSYAVGADGWVNRSASSWSSFLANTGEQVLTFLPRSRHDPFSVGQNIEVTEGRYRQYAADSVVAAHLRCADYELGVSSDVGTLLKRGIAVHTSALIDAERHASEDAFRQGNAVVMLATGTLAQGLNLPATAVVVGGTRIGQGQSVTGQTGQERIRAQLLNAVGRAGRAEFENHSIAMVIPTDPIAISSRLDGRSRGAEAAPFLSYEDASVPVRSALLPFMTRISREDLVIEAVDALTVEEMTAFTYAPRGDGTNDAPRVFARTLAAWTLADEAAGELGDSAASAVAQLGSAYFRQAEVPDWVREVAAQVGMPLPTLFALYRAAVGREIEQDDLSSIDGWLRRLIRLLARMEPRMSATMLFGIQLLGGPIREPSGWSFAPLAVDSAPSDSRRNAWPNLYRTLNEYLTGSPLIQVAATGLGLDPEEVATDHSRTAGTKALPRTIRLTKDLGERISLIAGGLLGLHYVGSDAEDTAIFWDLDDSRMRSLSYLPLAIRSGCGDLSSLSWYRFGIRYRRPAHLLGRLFPVPDDLPDDTAIRDWVRGARGRFLDDFEGMATTTVDPDERTVLLAVAAVMAGD